MLTDNQTVNVLRKCDLIFNWIFNSKNPGKYSNDWILKHFHKPSVKGSFFHPDPKSWKFSNRNTVCSRSDIHLIHMNGNLLNSIRTIFEYLIAGWQKPSVLSKFCAITSKSEILLNIGFSMVSIRPMGPLAIRYLQLYDSIHYSHNISDITPEILMYVNSNGPISEHWASNSFDLNKAVLMTAEFSKFSISFIYLKLQSIQLLFLVCKFLLFKGNRTGISFFLVSINVLINDHCSVWLLNFATQFDLVSLLLINSYFQSQGISEKWPELTIF